tara:strand:+ start:377 stop:532 length:156 start_codon:yes stop_codon:yes gene_type:complete
VPLELLVLLDLLVKWVHLVIRVKSVLLVHEVHLVLLVKVELLQEYLRKQKR